MPRTTLLLLVMSVSPLLAFAWHRQDTHEPLELEGFRVLVSNELLATEPALTDRALRELGNHLYRIAKVVPEPALAKLREVPIWISAKSETTCAAYHPSREWLAEHEGFDPRMARAMEIGNLRTFLDWTHHQPWMVLHELAHAYHHRVLGFDHAGILAAFGRAQAEARWADVLRNDGSRTRHYALTDHKEWFAEATEAFFGTNDFWPFVRAELRELDPPADVLLAEIWGVDPLRPPAGTPRSGK